MKKTETKKYRNIKLYQIAGGFLLLYFSAGFWYGTPAIAKKTVESEGVIPLEKNLQSTTNRISLFSGVRKFFFIRKPEMGAGLTHEFEEEIRTSNNDSTTVSNVAGGWIEVGTDGYVYHPTLLIYQLSARPEWRRSTIDFNLYRESTGDSYLSGHNIDLTFLKYKPYSLNLHSNKYNSTVKNQFSGKSETETSSHGANLSFRNKYIPVSVSYFHMEGRQKGYFASEDKGDTIGLNASFMRKNNLTTLASTFKETRHTSGEIMSEMNSSDHTLQNEWNITKDKSIVLNSFFSQRSSESEQIDYTDTDFTEFLSIRHRKNLNSNYRINIKKYRTQTNESLSKSFHFGLSHLLYENLTSNISGNTAQIDLDGGDETQYGGILGFNYMRKIPWGYVNLSTSRSHQVTEREFTAPYIYIMEKHELETTGLVTLENTEIDLETIVVTNSEGSEEYIRDTDYRITMMDSFVRISRTMFGAIDEGETVVVSYRYLSDSSFDSALLSQSFGAGINLWSFLSLSYMYNSSNREILAGIPRKPFQEDTFKKFSAKLFYKWKQTDTMISFLDVTRDSGVSSRTYSLAETITHRPARRIFLGITGNLGKREFTDSNQTENFFGVRTKTDILITYWCKYGFEGYMENINSESEKTSNQGITTGFELFYRIWNGSIRFNFVDENDLNNDNTLTRSNIYVEITRTLF